MNLLKNKLQLLLASCLFISQPLCLYAANSLEITADDLLLDNTRQVSRYRGHVVIKHQTMKIQADLVELHHAGQQLSQANIAGRPARVDHQPANEAAVHAEANRIEYYVSQQQLILIGKAKVQQGERSFAGEKIEYDLSNRVIKASSTTQDAEQDSRVHVIIGPETP